MPTLALLDFILVILERGPAVLNELFGDVGKIIADAQQNGELSQQDADAFKQRMEAAFASDYWTPESQSASVHAGRITEHPYLTGQNWKQQ